jgi:hypothetical protein
MKAIEPLKDDNGLVSQPDKFRLRQGWLWEAIWFGQKTEIELQVRRSELVTGAASEFGYSRDL